MFGRATGQPISRLLGGRHRERIKPYGSLLMAEPAQTADRVRAAIERGFRALKLGWGPFGRRDAATDEAIVRAARDAAGAAVELMVDAGASDAFWPHGYKWALRTAHMLAAHDIVWFEEPLRPDDIDGYAALTRTAPLPIAGGEVLTRRQSFLPWIERRAVDYLQPDVTKVGGLTEEHRIGQYADDHGIPAGPARLEHCRGTGRRPATGRRRRQRPAGSSTSPPPPISKTCSPSRCASTPTACWPSPTVPVWASPSTPTASPATAAAAACASPADHVAFALQAPGPLSVLVALRSALDAKQIRMHYFPAAAGTPHTDSSMEVFSRPDDDAIYRSPA